MLWTRGPGALGGRCGEDFGEAEDPVLVQGCAVQADEVGFGVEAEDLDPSRKGLVSELLFPPPVELFLVAACGVVVVVIVTDGDPAGLGDVHVREAVGFDGLVVEPGAVAGFPLEAADHAEFGAAAAGHVIAAFFELDGGGAVEAALPSFFLCDLDEFLGGGVFGTFPAGMPFVVARAADFGLAPLAFAIFPASVGATAGIDVDMCRFDP